MLTIFFCIQKPYFGVLKLTRRRENKNRYDKLERVIAELANSPAATTDVNKSTYLLQVYALEISLYGATKVVFPVAGF